MYIKFNEKCYYIFPQVSYYAEGKPPTTLDVRSDPTTTSVMTSMSSLLPGRTYTINVTAVSKGKLGEVASIMQTTGKVHKDLYV